MLFQYYDEKLECDMKEKDWGYNIKNYKKYAKKLPKKMSKV